jgi:hypothetical protein
VREDGIGGAAAKRLRRVSSDVLVSPALVGPRQGHTVAAFFGLFILHSAFDRVPILSTPGVVLIVGQGRTPQPIDADEVNAIRVAVNSGNRVEPWPQLEVGRTVRIEEGSLRGLEGVLLRFKGTNQLILGVQLLQRAVAVEVPDAWVVPCKPTIPVVNATETRSV